MRQAVYDDLRAILRKSISGQNFSAVHALAMLADIREIAQRAVNRSRKKTRSASYSSGSVKRW